MEITGKIKKIFETENVTASFKKRGIVVTTQEQYPQDVLIEFQHDNCDKLNPYSVGTDVVVGINIRGREWINPEGVAKYFNTIVGWKIGYTQNSNQYAAATNDMPPQAGPTNSFDQANNADDDDLPF